ncbi:MAG: ABC transporter ATP-binding protein, partial [Chitinophagaceae bacterium]
MNYNLYEIQQLAEGKNKSSSVLKKLGQLIGGEKKNLFIAFIAIIIGSGLNLLGPLLIGLAIDKYVETKQMHGVLVYSSILLVIYIMSLAATSLQTQYMGAIGQRMLFNLRNSVFSKIQELPVAFFNQNKAGDLISRINNDTDKLNQFFSQSLMRFLGIIVTMIGAGIFLISISPRLGGAALIPGAFILIFTKFISPWVKRKNAASLKSVGGMSGEIQESLDNFKTIIAFNRRDYFRKKFDDANQDNYQKAVGAGISNNLLMPVYSLFSNIAQLIVLAYGIYLISQGEFTVGFLISFLSYANRFYSPLRQLAALWASFQTALAAWDRISVVLGLHPDVKKEGDTLQSIKSNNILEFKDVYFSYDGKKEILSNVSFNLQRSKT